jgi:hypothetical protein
MKIKRFFFNVFLLLIFAGVVFFIGWFTFLVKPGTIGVMESKTSGLYEQPVYPGQFVWRWERLLPTNVRMHIFSASAYETTSVVSGELPSAALYRSQLDPSPDFSYRVELKVSLAADGNKLVTLVKNNLVADDSELNLWLHKRSDEFTSACADYLMKNYSNGTVVPKALSSSQIEQILSTLGENFKGISVSDVVIVSAVLPDLSLYEKGKASYEAYNERISTLLMEKASDQAATLAEEDRTMAQLERFGQLLSKYPQLEELSKQGSITDIIAALRKSGI